MLVLMKLELLPNEILFECFKFLNTFEIFHSFDQLNDHFNHLIRSIPLHLDFQNVQKSTFDQFWAKMLPIPEIVEQIHSLKLSNKDTCGQIEAFLSPGLFSHLRSLTLTEIGENNIEKLTFILPLLPQLCSFHLITPKNGENEIIAALSTSKLRTLSTPTLWPILTFTHKISSITNLTITCCSLNQLLHQLFRYAPMLKYLNIEYLSDYYDWTTINSSNEKCNAVHLQQLIIMNFEYTFKKFEMLVKQTPNLTSLTIHGNCDIDANRWENLITSSLVCLETFKFVFSYTRTNDDDYIIDKFKQFQSNFWQEQQHHWLTEYSLSRYSTVIYTIPYMSNSYKLEPDINRYFSERMNTSIIFDKVTDLILSHEEIKKECQYYFSNVNSVNIIAPERYYKPSLGVEHIRSLKMMVNLSNLKHFGIASKCRIKGSSVLLELLKQAPQLSSMTISARTLALFKWNSELCQYLNKMIKKLDLYQNHCSSFKSSYEIDRFCETFSNLEQLKCNIDRSDKLLLLLNNLPKLSTVKVYIFSLNDHEYFYYWFKKETWKLKCLFDLKCIGKYQTELSVWMDKNKN